MAAPASHTQNPIRPLLRYSADGMTDRPGAGGEAVEVDEVEQVAARRARRGAEEKEGCGDAVRTSWNALGCF